jgi:hypothetical protein
VIDATKASSRPAAIVSELSQVDPAGPPMPADRALGNSLKDELYSSHVARWEYRHADEFAPGYWAETNAEQVYNCPQLGLVIRALFDKPRVPQPEKEHAFKNRTCTRCGDPEDWAGPDCVPLVQEADQRGGLPFDPRWLVQPLQWLRDAAPLPSTVTTGSTGRSKLPSRWKSWTPHYGVRQAVTQKQISHPEGLPACAAGHLVECCCRSTSKKAGADAAPSEWRRINRPSRNSRAVF